MINNVVRLDRDAFELVDESVNGIYSIVMDDWRLARTTVAASDQSVSQNLAYSFGSLSRVIFAFYKNNYANGGCTADVNGSRSNRNVSEYSFALNGQYYPSQKVQCDKDSNISEVMAEIRNSSRQSTDFSQETTLSKASFVLSETTGIGAGNIGTSFYELDLESLRQYNTENGLFSGLYTIGGTTNLELKMSEPGTNSVDLLVWGQYQATLSLNTRTDNIFSYTT